MKELKIGERVTITLEAVEQTSCVGCCFDNGDILVWTQQLIGIVVVCSVVQETVLTVKM